MNEHELVELLQTAGISGETIGLLHGKGAIDDSVLRHLTENDLVTLGIEDLVERKRVVDFIDTRYGSEQSRGMISPTEPSKWIALLFLVIGGAYGLHRIYCNHYRTGAAQLALTITGALTARFLLGYVFLLAVGIWLIVDLVFILNGRMTGENIPRKS